MSAGAGLAVAQPERSSSDPGASAPLPPALTALLEVLSPLARVELRRVLHHELFPNPSPAQVRRKQLGSLARLLRTHGSLPPAPPGSERLDPERRAQTKRSRKAGSRPTLSPYERWPTVSQMLYDELREPGAPTAESLMAQTRAEWPLICRMAAYLDADEPTLINGGMFISAQRGGPGTRSRDPYTREDCLDALHKCAAALGREVGALTAEAYIKWSRARRMRARRNARTPEQLRAVDPRLPDYGIIKRRFGSWARVVRAAAKETRASPPSP